MMIITAGCRIPVPLYKTRPVMFLLALWTGLNIHCYRNAAVVALGNILLESVSTSPREECGNARYVFSPEGIHTVYYLVVRTYCCILQHYRW